MCVICVKPEGVEMPPWDTIESCFWSNPDGAGFAIARDGNVMVKKGFFDLNDYIDNIKSLDVSKDESFLMHMRIATHGGKGWECTHPFPISNSWSEMHKREYTAPSVVAHNGIFSGIGSTSEKKKISDSMVFAKILYESKLHIKAMRSDYWANILKRTVGPSNKVAIMYKNGQVFINGDDWYKEEGCYFSNKSYRGLITNGYSPFDYMGSPYEDYCEDPYGCFKGEDAYWNSRNPRVYKQVLAYKEDALQLTSGVCPMCFAYPLRRIHREDKDNLVFRCDTCYLDWYLTQSDLQATKEIFPDIVSDEESQFPELENTIV